MKNKFKLLLVVVILITGALLSDWDTFKAGLLEKPAVAEVENGND